ncbi:MAG: MBL fold metallo-hydrolase [Pseudomonadota bacterium]
MSSPEFRLQFEPRHGELVEVAPGIGRIVCNNPSPFTFHGTNTYLLGTDELAVVDPGPIDNDHFDALITAIDKRPVSHILITHTHVDHSPLAARLRDVTGARTYGEGPHRAARPLALGETNALDASGDSDFAPDVLVKHDDLIEGDGWTAKALFTPGHTANHLAFALDGTDYLLSGDHVMAWATSIVAPPDGSMADYMASLDTMLEQPQSIYFPGHGGRLENAHAFVRALRAHRKMREQAVLDQVRKGRTTIPEMVAIIYRSTDPKLHGAAGLSVLAHLEDLVGKGEVVCDGPPMLGSMYRPV